MKFGIKRPIKFWLQRRLRGWDDSITWSLDYGFYEWIHPRLLRYMELAPKMIVIEPDFQEALDKMIKGFNPELDDILDWPEVNTLRKEAHNAFNKWHGAMWW